MASEELLRKCKWLKRHLLFKTVSYTSERTEKGGFKHWGWKGKVVEVTIGYWDDFFIEITLDWGHAFTAHEGVYEWPAGPWGPAGCLRMSDYEDTQER